jgi:hypothetical protein
MGGDFEYILHVWEKEPEDKSKLPSNYWRAHIKNAPYVPVIGQALESSSGAPDDYNRFRVFEVRDKIGGSLGELVTEGMSKLKSMQTPEGKNGLTLVLAYRED